MIRPKTADELHRMRIGGHKLGIVLDELLAMAIPGVTLTEIEERSQKRIKELGGSPSFQTVEDYKWSTCLCVNEAVVHGIPTPYVLQIGDVLTIDVGMLYEGLHTDTAWTKIITDGKTGVDPEKIRLLEVGKQALAQALLQAKHGNRIGNISEVIQKTVEGAGFSIIKSLVGHGVGYELHEDPQIPGYVRGAVANTMKLEKGMTIAVEIIYAAGGGAIVYENNDGWTLSTKDRSLSSVFEHTIAITEGEPEILSVSEATAVIYPSLKK